MINSPTLSRIKIPPKTHSLASFFISLVFEEFFKNLKNLKNSVFLVKIGPYTSDRFSLVWKKFRFDLDL